MELNYILKLSIIFSGLVIITASYLLASGSLDPKRLNIINVSYYYFIAFTYFGGSLAFLGYRDHYLIAKVTSNEIFNVGFLVILIVGILLPILMFLFNQTLKRLMPTRSFESYIREPVSKRIDTNVEKLIILAFSLVSIAVIIAFHAEAEHIPFIGWLRESNHAVARKVLTLREYINPYIKSIFMLHLPMALSYYAYIKLRSTKERFWIILFLTLFIVSIAVKTYNYEKAPVLFYILNYYLIEVLLGSIKSIRVPLLVGGLLLAIVLFMYSPLAGYTGDVLSLVRGPFSRIIFSQVAGLFMTFNLFPGVVPFLAGRSLPTIITKILGIDKSWIRSGRVIMEIVNPTGVADNTAGVMSTLFVGEAYANWGVLGIGFSLLLVSFLYSVTHTYLLKSEKSAVNITIYVILFSYFTSWFQGGFVDYVFNSVVVLLLLFFITLKIILEITTYTIENKISLRS